jgi:hypothetical protein
MTGLLGTAHSMNQASYDLARLSRNGLIIRMSHRNLYALTPDGLRFAIFYTKVHDRVLRLLMAADQPQAPPPIRAAVRVIDTEVARRIAAARLPAQPDLKQDAFCEHPGQPGGGPDPTWAHARLEHPRDIAPDIGATSG